MTEELHIEKITELLTGSTEKDTIEYYIMRTMAKNLYKGGCRIVHDNEVIMTKNAVNNAIDSCKMVCKIQNKIYEIVDLLEHKDETIFQR